MDQCTLNIPNLISLLSQWRCILLQGARLRKHSIPKVTRHEWHKPNNPPFPCQCPRRFHIPDNNTLAADEIGNNHLGVYKQPYSLRRPLWLEKAVCACQTGWILQNPLHHTKKLKARPKVIIPNFICPNCSWRSIFQQCWVLGGTL